MENCIKTLNQIDKTHRGLGIYVLLNQLCVNAKRSVFNVAPSGSGKKILINGIKAPMHVTIGQDTKWDAMTYTEILNRIGYLHFSDTNQTTLLWRVEEFGTLSRYHRDTLLSIASKIISDHCYYKEMGGVRDSRPIDIKNCNLVMLIGIQPIVLGDLINTNIFWQSLGNDRFLKLVVLNPLRNKEIDTMPQYEPSRLEVDNILVPERPLLIAKLLQNQVSDGRTSSWARDLLISYMSYENYSEYSIKYELEFSKLFGEIIRLFSRTSYTVSLDLPIKVAGGSLMMLNEIAKHSNNGGITQDELAETFRIYTMQSDNIKDENRKNTIRYHAKILLSSLLIKKIQDDPITYTLSDNLQNFFNWYEGIIN